MNNVEQKNEEKTAEMLREETINLMVNALNRIGCQPDVLEDKSLNVTYQGENFHVEFGGPFAQIWDPSWTSINVNDPEFDTAREAINSTNFGFGPTVVMSKPDEDGIVYIHSRYSILLEEGINDIACYVQQSLNLFFDKKQDVRQNLERLRIEKQQIQAGRRPIGFQTNLNETENS